MKKRLTPAELDARLKFVVGCVMATVLTLTTIGVIYALVFVTQPIGAQAENDKMFFSVLSSIATFITGTLAGLMISNWATCGNPSVESAKHLSALVLAKQFGIFRFGRGVSSK